MQVFAVKESRVEEPINTSPVNPLPPVVVLLVAAMLLLEAAFSLGREGLIGGAQAVGWRSEAIQTYGFSNRAFSWMVENRVFNFDYALRLFTFPYIHGGFTQTLFGVVMTLALGKFVGEKLHQVAVLALFVVPAALGAAIYGLVLPDGPGLIGAFPGVYGLIGGFTYLIWLRLGEIGEKQSQAFSLIGLLLFIQLIFAVFFGTDSTWLADVTGFVAGFGLSFFLSPGGWRKIREKLQQRS